MAYNPTLYNPYGQQYPQIQQQIQQPFTLPQQAVKGVIEWVDGEAAAKSYQMPVGLNKPVALWDTNDTVIYLKSMNPMGMPNPLQKIYYRIEDGQSGVKQTTVPALESGDTEPEKTYVSMEEFVKMKEELLQAIRESAVRDNPKHAVKGE